MFAQYTEFGAYGSVLRSKDACGGDLFRNEEHVGWKVGELLVKDRTLGAFSLHDNTSEAFIPLEGTAVLVVARKDDLSDQKSFLLDRPVIIEPSVWHGPVSYTHLDASAAMYALISVFVMNVVIDQVLEGPGLARSHIIITTRGDEMAERILKELDRGVTALDAKGMYSGEGRTMLLCVVSRLEAVRLRTLVYSVDPRAFVIVQNVHEALGEGFKELHT